MRSILKKLDRQELLQADEYQRLMEYADKLRADSPESYALFHDKFALQLYKEYSTYIPRFAYGIDDLIDFLASQPELLSCLEQGKSLSLSIFPVYLHPYLLYSFGSKVDRQFLQPILGFLKESPALIEELPCPRQNRVVYKYEDANPYKEAGLKAHFDRLGRYSFITRLQTYRYLRRNKASQDRIEYLSPDKLGGIFTNKEKSIYYYIFLTEKDSKKAQNAEQLLNIAFYEGFY